MRLKTFGGLQIEVAGVVVGGAAARRRPLAVLAVLAAAGPRGVSRDKLGGIFWPESDGDRARNALNQTLFALRRDLGERHILRGTADLRLNPDVITSDVGDFDAAHAAGNLELVAVLATAPFLDGVYLKDAPEFERWLDGERARLELATTGALRTLAAQATARHDHERAAAWYQRLLALDLADVRATVGLMSALAAAGDRAGALRQARVHATYLRDELHAAVDPAVATLAEQLRTAAVVGPAADRPAPPPAPVVDPVRSATLSDPTPHRAPPSAMVADRGDDERPATTAPDGGPSAPTPRLRAPISARRLRTLRWTRRLTLPAAALTTLVAGGWALLGKSELAAGTEVATRGAAVAARAADVEVIAVVPFRVSGADARYDYLREGMVDLLSAALADGTHTRHAADPGVLLNAWNSAARAAESKWTSAAAVDVARRIGASKVVLGAVVGSPERVVLRAQLVDVRGGRTEAAAEVVGAPDSLPGLVEQLAIRLLAGETGERKASVAGLAGTPLAAVQSYLDGRAAYRRGDYDRALAHQKRALDGDSTFALAAIELCRVAGWVGNSALRHRGYSVAWRERARLSAPDRLYLRAVAGPHYPAPSTRVEWLRAWEQLAEAEPEHPEGWFEVGDLLFHSPWMATPDGEPARAFFLRSLAQAPTFIPALQHLTQLAARTRDTAMVREMGTRAVNADPNGDVADFIRWRMARSLHDSAALARSRADFATMGLSPLMWVAVSALSDASAPDDAELALQTRLRRSTTIAERSETLLGLHNLAVARGRRDDAARAVAALDRVPSTDLKALQFRVYDALYAGGDSAAAATAVRALLRTTVVTDSTAIAAFWRRHLRGYCAAGQWYVFRGDPAGAARVAQLLRQAGRGDLVAGAADGDDEPWSAEARMCALLVDAALAVNARRPDAAARLQQLDSYLAEGPSTSSLSWDMVCVATARLFERAGDLPRALAAVRRRDRYYRWPQYLAVQLHDEGRLAWLTGDRAGAAAAYRHYLSLRTSPDGPAEQEVAKVSALLRDYAVAR